MLGFYAYLPDITLWLRMQPEFPLKNYLLQLDAQTLQLIVFTFLLFVVLTKVSSFESFCLTNSLILQLYIAAIIWYCYGYVTALTMARSIGIITTHNDDPYPVLGGVKI